MLERASGSHRMVPRQNVSSAAQAEDFDKRVTRWAEDVESTDGGAERAAAAALRTPVNNFE